MPFPETVCMGCWSDFIPCSECGKKCCACCFECDDHDDEPRYEAWLKTLGEAKKDEHRQK